MNLECNHQTWSDDFPLLISPYLAFHHTFLVSPAVAVGADLTDLSPVTSQSCTTPPDMLEMTWTVQINVKHLDLLRSTDPRKDVNVVTEVHGWGCQCLNHLWCFCSSFSACWSKVCVWHLEQRTLHDHSGETTVKTLTPYWTKIMSHKMFTTRHSSHIQHAAVSFSHQSPLAQYNATDNQALPHKHSRAFG